MKIWQKTKQEKGITEVDLTISIIIVMVFVSIISALFYNIYITSQSTKRNAQANSYVTNVFAQINRSSYDEVTTQKLVQFVNGLGDASITAASNQLDSLNTPYRMYITVTSYKDMPENSGRNLKDYVKRIDIKVKYNVGKQEQTKSYSMVKQIEIE